MNSGDTMQNPSTRVINAPAWHQKVGSDRCHILNPPVYRASTVLFDCYEDLAAAGRGQYRGLTYGTDGSPNQHAFEAAMAAVEGGFRTWAFPSGISAITNALLAFVKSGDHILLCDNVYGPTRRFCDTILPRFGISTDYLPPDIGAEVEDHLNPRTRLIFMESPGSNTFEIQDIPAITAVARRRGIVTLLDNTWATPLYLNPFDLGVDVSIHSVTKYISGHSDVLMGTVTTTEAVQPTFADFYRTLEIYASPDDCYLALRGLKTLSVRLRQHEQSALALARWLAADERVGQVLHPALASHPNHDRWQRMFKGASGLFAFVLAHEVPEERIAAFVNHLELFGLGYSWGGYKSLMTVGTHRRCRPLPYGRRPVFRIHVGLEEVEDLKADLRQAMVYLQD
jgi:cystathionine beta-lyase